MVNRDWILGGGILGVMAGGTVAKTFFRGPPLEASHGAFAIAVGGVVGILLAGLWRYWLADHVMYMLFRMASRKTHRDG